jgi:broad specificity phosphatase PhoE
VEACRAAGRPEPRIIVEPRWDEFDLDAIFAALAPRLSGDDPEFRAEYEKLVAALADEASAIHRTWTRCDTDVFRAWVTECYPYEGESWTAFSERVMSCRDLFHSLGPKESAAVFTSATPISIWIGQSMGLDIEKTMRLAGVMHNSAISSLRVHNGSTMLFSFNGIPHLKDPAMRTFR